MTEPLGADHRVHLARCHPAIVGPAGEGRLGYLAGERGEIVADEVHQQRGGVLAELISRRPRPRLEPGHERAARRPRQRDHRRRRQGPQQPVAGAQLHAGEEQEHGAGIGRAHVGGEGLARLGGQGLHAPRDDEPPVGQERQRERGAHDGVGARLPGVEHLARERGRAGIREQGARDRRDDVIEEHRLAAMHEDHGRRAPRLRRAEEPPVVHSAVAH